MKTIQPILNNKNFSVFKVPYITTTTEIKLISTPINAGFPSPADDYIEDIIDLNMLMIKHPSSTYILKVKGASMIDAGIFDKSLIIVDASLQTLNNDIAVCIIDGEFTLKRISIEGSKIYLMPENKSYKPIEIKEGSNLTVWGVITWVLNKPNNKRM